MAKRERIVAFYRRHKRYFSTVLGYSFAVSLFMAVINWFYSIFVFIREGNFFGFFITVVFYYFIIPIFTIIGTLSTAIVTFLITLVPYLIIRGLPKQGANKKENE